jgi:serine phosphatase RsbU (regulator of sigma subunit)
MDDADAAESERSPTGGRRLPGTAAGALVLGLLLTAALAATTSILHDRNESRLLRLRARELDLVLTAVVPSIQTPLASAAELADATNGDPKKFRRFMASYVGPKKQFASVSLWRGGVARPVPVVVLGTPPALASRPDLARQFFGRTDQTPGLRVVGFLKSSPPSLGYGFSTPGTVGGYTAYAENPLPANGRSKAASGQGFSDLHYAVYLGRSRRHGQLLVTDVSGGRLTGRTAADVVPFGNTALTLVVAPIGSLGGRFFASLPWLIAIVGGLLSIAAALMTSRIVRRRQHAERLAATLDRVADENRLMYDQQRSIAQTLQHALLPASFPEVPGLLTSARYVPAASGIDVGGDWYDLVVADDRHVVLLVGDVSGHGLDAATTMASLRHTALAYAAEDHRPASILSKLAAFVGGTPHKYLATVMCALVDVDARRVTIASAGHPPPLLLASGEGRFAEQRTGPAIGVARSSHYEETSVSLPSMSTLIAFTDGLVERRGEILDTGLERLRNAATSRSLPLDELVTMLARDLASESHHDDTAIVGIRWQR